MTLGEDELRDCLVSLCGVLLALVIAQRAAAMWSTQQSHRRRMDGCFAPAPVHAGGSSDKVANMASTFAVVTYNMLARSLGSNSIPWVMDVPPAAVALADAALTAKHSRRLIRAAGAAALPPPPTRQCTWAELARGPLASHYIDHFHKNYDSGDYQEMRRFFGARKVVKISDVPKPLRTRLEVVAEDCVQYKGAHGQNVRCRTLRGLLRNALNQDAEADGRDVGDEVFRAIMELDARVYDWEVRGPRVFRALMAEPFHLLTLEERRYPSLSRSGDILVLQEYDVHEVQAEYDIDDGRATFAEAMKRRGFAGAFFCGTRSEAGIGVFWRESVFACEAGGSDDGAARRHIACGQELRHDADGTALSNHDLGEVWRPIRRRNASAVVATQTSSGQEAATPDRELMKDADRRNCAFARLRHRDTGAHVCMIALHLMTTSRDCEDVTYFPGEVRAGELAAIRQLVAAHAERGDAVILAGDFNTQPHEMSVFTGSCASPPLDTGFDAALKAFHWHDREGNAIRLAECLERTHRWCANELEQKYCTSANGVRQEWIDYVFAGPPATVQVVASAGALPKIPKVALPNELHGSDHVPIGAEFAFVQKQADGEDRLRKDVDA
ncbi:hypothetical protein FVE85_6939 [Porphyridium purpureum]|uniref:Endonuclease/exonuclease/phosphatase domain-containing protein n=1 Tax=Porphyridium purpureum TaxID=35688 RepID=A0A5J4Z8P2_PORPP|nr:hypothetical protein FVE85_6939 [Porphyridium purpureum]|eukprot:POR5573..scf295_1